MRILYLVHQFYPEWYTGTEKFVLNLATMMQKLGNKVYIITYSFYENSFYDQKIGDIILKEFTYEGLPVIALRHKKITEDIHTALENRDMAKIASDIIVKKKPDIIHVGHPMRVSELIKASNMLQIPYIVTLTDFFLMCPKFILSTSKGHLCAGPEGGNACHNLCPEFPKSFIIQRLEIAKDILLNAKSVIAPSKFLAGVFKKEFESLDIKAINYGLSYNKIRENVKSYKKGDEIIFCYAGSLTYHKGVHIVIDAFKKITSSKAILKIYGSGPDELYVKKLKVMVTDDKRIELCGVFSEDQIGNILCSVDIVIVPSLWYENNPFVLNEALACNVPVIASNVGGMAEKIKDGINGFLFKIGNSEHLKEVIETIIDNPETLNVLKKNIRGYMVPTREQEAYAYEREYERRVVANL